MSLDISCAFPPSLATPDHIAAAERLGYHRAWCYDSPSMYADVWMTLARAAERTTHIGLGAGVLVPSLRHVLTNAAAAATLVALAPGRVVLGVGAGMSARLALGQRPVPWRDVAEYIRALRGLLRGEVVEWESASIQMGHPSGFAPSRPIDLPLLVAAQGPKGTAVAHELGDGAFSIGPTGGFDWVAELLWGTVLDPDENVGSDRALAAAAHGAAVFYHATYDAHGWGSLDALPLGDQWRRRADDIPRGRRHLAVHANHLVDLNELDRGLVTGEVLGQLGVALDANGWRARLAKSEQAGVTEIVYQPAGPDVPRELAAFAHVAMAVRAP